ncbi:POK9 protein, partial [Smithornis capensis]|nr:POK9 protein [Smithornis capensis]
RGSLGLDLATAVEVILTSCQPQCIPTTTNGPIFVNGQAKGALLLGRSSSGLRGLIILPGLIDADYTGNIQIVAYAMQPPMIIPKGSKIAQLVLLDNLVQDMAQGVKQQRGNQNFGSTGGLALLSLRLNRRPVVNALLDNG